MCTLQGLSSMIQEVCCATGSDILTQSSRLVSSFCASDASHTCTQSLWQDVQQGHINTQGHMSHRLHSLLRKLTKIQPK